MAFLVKRNETYYIRYNKNGRMAWRSCRTNKKAIAKEILRKFTDESARVEWNLSKGRKISFQDLCAKYIDSAYGIKSEDWIKIESIYIHTHYLPFFGANELAKNITKERIEEYRIHRLKKVSKGTVNKETTVLVSILRKGAEWGLYPPHLVPKIRKIPVQKRSPRFLSEDEMERLILTAKNYSDEMERFVMIALYTGLRRKEILSLKWEKIDLHNKQIIVEQDTKNREFRSVPLPDRLVKVLKSTERHTESDWVFYTPEGNKRKTIRNALMTVFQSAGFSITGDDKVTTHILRHTYASHLVMKGVPLYTVSILLGHKTTEMTKRYAHLAPQHLHDAISVLP